MRTFFCSLKAWGANTLNCVYFGVTRVSPYFVREIPSYHILLFFVPSKKSKTACANMKKKHKTWNSTMLKFEKFWNLYWYQCSNVQDKVVEFRYRSSSIKIRKTLNLIRQNVSRNAIIDHNDSVRFHLCNNVTDYFSHHCSFLWWKVSLQS
jgi:hypothetical protein